MEIMFEDLNYETQKKLLEEAGVGAPEEMGWDINPIAIIEFDDDDDNSEDDFLGEKVIDDQYDDGEEDQQEDADDNSAY